MGGMLFFSLRGGINHPKLVVSIHLKENLSVVNINYLLMPCNVKDKLRDNMHDKHDTSIVKLSLMPTSPIIFTTLKLKIHYLFEFIVIIKFVLPSHHSETHFPHKDLAIAQVGATPFIIFTFHFLGLWLSRKLLM